MVGLQKGAENSILKTRKFTKVSLHGWVVSPYKQDVNDNKFAETNLSGPKKFAEINCVIRNKANCRQKCAS